VSPPAPEAAASWPLPPEQPQRFFPGVGYFPYGHAMEWRFARGGFDDPGPAFVWGRPRIALVEGEPLHGTEALLALLDSANGVSCELDIRQWTFVPVDLTLNLHRVPQGPWYALDARTVCGADGIGTVHTTVFDAQGPVGRSLHTLFVRPRPAGA
jgi:Thioesterase-like superfamily